MKTDKDIVAQVVKDAMKKKGIPDSIMLGDLTGKELEVKISEHLRKAASARKKK